MERLENPHVPLSSHRGMPNAYKIKIRNAEFRLIYTVDEGIICVKVIAVGKGDKLEDYKNAKDRV